MRPAIPVLHILNGEQYSGLERVVDYLADGAPAYGFRVHLVLLKRGVMAARLHSEEAVLHSTPMRGRFDLAAALQVARLAKETGAALIHSHTVRSALIGRAVKALSGMPWVHHVHSPALFESERRVLIRVNHFVEQWVLGRADQLIAVSDALTRHATSAYGVPDTRLVTVHNGVADQPDSAPPSNQVPVIGCVGLFRHRKGLEVLLDAARIVRDEGCCFRVRLIGEFESAEYRWEIERRISGASLQPYVELVGFVRDVAAELRACDLYVLPSLFGEGLPMALIEAMASAKPIIASRIDGITEALTEECGWLVAPGDPRALAGAIRTAIGAPDRARSLGLSARDRQRRSFSCASMCEGVFRTYDLAISPLQPAEGATSP